MSISSMSQHPYVLFVKTYEEYKKLEEKEKTNAETNATECDIVENDNKLWAIYEKMWELGTEVMLIGEINQKKYVRKVAKLFNNLWLGTLFN